MFIYFNPRSHVLNFNIDPSCLEPIEHCHHGNCDMSVYVVDGSMSLITDAIGLELIPPILASKCTCYVMFL